MKHVTRWIALSLLALTALVLVYSCGEESSPTRPKNGILQLDAKAFRFSPDAVLLRPGESAVFEITSQDMDHTFTVDELGINSEIPAGQTVSVEMTASAERTYTYYCAIPGHREQGMEGTVSVRAVRQISTGGSSGGGGGY